MPDLTLALSHEADILGNPTHRARAVHCSGLQRLSLNGSRRSSLTCCQWVSVGVFIVSGNAQELACTSYGRGRLRTRRCGRGARLHRTRTQDRRRYLLCDAMSGGRACEEGGESRDARAGLGACLSNSPPVRGAAAVQHRRFACDAHQIREVLDRARAHAHHWRTGDGWSEALL